MTGKKTLLAASSLTVCTASASWAMTGPHPAVANPDIPQRTNPNWDLKLVAHEAHRQYLKKLSALAEVVEGKPLTYEVKKGDNLYRIGLRFGVHHFDLAEYNQIIDPRRLQIGRKLKIPLVPKMIQIQKGDTLATLTKKYGITDSLIQFLNPSLLRSEELKPGDPFMVAEKIETQQTDRKQAKVIPLSKASAKEEEQKVQKTTTKVQHSSDFFLWPVKGTITSEYGMRHGDMHKGIDIWSSDETNEVIEAAKEGVVVRAGYSNGYGNLVVIDHGSGWVTYYAHLSSIHVSKGDQVTAGQNLGNMGMTGNSTGPHLHFEIRKDGEALNPLRFLD